jgi:SAM-dependent methyltransferase
LAELPIRLAKERYGLDISLAELADDRRDGFYDVITMWGLVEHVKEPRSLIGNAARLLASGGVLGILTPVRGLYDEVGIGVYRLSGVTNLLDHRNTRAHLSILSRRACLMLLEQQGLVILYAQALSDYYQPIPNYLRNIGIQDEILVRALAAVIRFWLDRGWFFRNNILVYAKRPE